MNNYLQELFIDEAKPALYRHSSGSNGSDMDALVDRSITEVTSNAASVGAYAFYNCTNLTSINLPVATSIGTNAFQNCSALTSVDCPSVTSMESGILQSCTKLTSANFQSVISISSSAFKSCAKLTSTNFQSATSIGSSAFQYCSALTLIDLPSVTSIGSGAFQACSYLVTLILRNTEKVCTLSATSALSLTAIADGTGYIYVPSTLIESYKTASNWSTYSTQFRVLEDFTVDGTVTGELDPTKI